MGQLTEQEWKRVLPLLENIKPERQQAAYNRLVKNMTLVKAGEPYGYSRQDVNKLCDSVLRKHAKLMNEPEKFSVPSGWTRVTFVVPRRHLAEVRRIVEALHPQPSGIASASDNRTTPLPEKPAGLSGRRSVRVKKA